MCLDFSGPGASVDLRGGLVEHTVALGVGGNHAVAGFTSGGCVDAGAGFEDGEGLLAVRTAAVGHGPFLHDWGALEETRTHCKDGSAGSTDLCPQVCRSGSCGTTI